MSESQTPALPEDISPAALALIVNAEVGGAAGYVARCSRPTYPGGWSGVTIGIGEDLGQLSIAQFHADWDGYLSAADAARLGQCCGAHAPNAQTMAQALHDIEIPYDVAMIVFRRRRLPGFITLAWNTFPNCAELPPDAFGALVSLVYNRGASLADPPGDTAEPRREMREIVEAMRVRNIDAVPPLIRSMTRLWPTLHGLCVRRDAEADLFQAAIGTG